LVKLLSRHTGNVCTICFKFLIVLCTLRSVKTLSIPYLLYQPPEKIDKVMRGPFYMDSLKAKEFGVIDKVLFFLHLEFCSLHIFSVIGICDVNCVQRIVIYF
jgi:hypothetical protein